MSRAVLYQCTQALVISSRSASDRTGPARNGDPARVHSVLYSPMVVSACALSRAPPTVPTEGVSPASSRVWANRTEVSCEPASEWRIAPLPQRAPLPCSPGGGLPDRPLHERGFLAQRAFPPGDQPGERVDDQRGVPEAPAVQRHVREAGHVRQHRYAAHHARPQMVASWANRQRGLTGIGRPGEGDPQGRETHLTRYPTDHVLGAQRNGSEVKDTKS